MHDTKVNIPAESGAGIGVEAPCGLKTMALRRCVLLDGSMEFDGWVDDGWMVGG